MADSDTAEIDPLEFLGRWLGEAEAAGIPVPRAMTLATAAADGRPSARLVSLKRLSGEALVFTTALWTRKAGELLDNPYAAATFHWPALGRQARVEGRAEIAERALAEELFAERPRGHQLQAHASRQGEETEGLDRLRERLDEVRDELGQAPMAGASPCLLRSAGFPVRFIRAIAA